MSTLFGMSKTAVELGTFPPRGTTVILQLLPLRVPQPDGTASILWNMTGRYATPEGGTAICFSLTGDDPVGAAHIAGGLCSHFKLAQAQEVPPAATDLAKFGLPGVPTVAQLAFAQGGFRQPQQDVTTDLETFMQTVQTFVDLQARAAAMGVAQFATKMADAEAKKLFLAKLPESLKVGPHPKTGDYASACGAKLTVCGPKLEGECLSGGPCKLTTSGRCWRWKGTEDIEGTPAVDATALAAGIIEVAAENIIEGPVTMPRAQVINLTAATPIEVDAPPSEVETPTEETAPVVEPPVEEKKSAAPKKVAATKKAAPKKAAKKSAPKTAAKQAEAAPAK